MAGWATQIYAEEFDARLAALPLHIRELIIEKIGEMGRRLDTSPHHRLSGRAEYRLRIGEYRVIYHVDRVRNEIELITLGHRREVYR